VVPLPGDHPAPAAPPETRPGRLHGLATAGMAVSAVLGFFATFAFITVGWPGRTGRFVIGIVVVAGIAFLSFAAIAVFTAARDTYANRGRID
jgi:hypothetical protein